MRSAHAGGVAPVLTGSSTELDTSNYVMVRETLASRRALPAASRTSAADDTMDDIIEPVQDANPIAGDAGNCWATRRWGLPTTLPRRSDGMRTRWRTC